MDYSAVLKKKSRVITDKLGEPVKWTPAGGTTKSIRGIFSRAAGVVYTGSVAIQTNEPIVRVWTKTVPGIAAGDTIVCQGVTYKVMRFESNVNTGDTKVYLKDT